VKYYPNLDLEGSLDRAWPFQKVEFETYQIQATVGVTTHATRAKRVRCFIVTQPAISS
jgi:hypothetical protein